MNKRSIVILLSIVLGGSVLFAGYKALAKNKEKSNQIVNDVVTTNRDDKVHEVVKDSKVDNIDDKYDIDNKEEIDDKDVENEINKIEENKENSNKVHISNNKDGKEDNTNGIYKKGVTETEVESLDNKYDNKVNFRVLYGTAFAQNGGGPIYETGNELGSAKEFFKTTDDILNELWKDLRNILNPSVFKNLQQNQIEWIKTRDEIADTVGKPGDFKYIDKQGRETYIRIRYLINTYLD